MAPARTLFCPLLLLLLALWVTQHPVSAKPNGMTSAQWFEIQHVHKSPVNCKNAMKQINNDSKSCKNLNTFLHEPFSSVAKTCQTQNKQCKNGRNNCHQSPKPVSLTNCKHTSGTYPNCNYKNEQKNAYYIIACDPKDNQNKELLPVHLDSVI
ncbi:ribonuclease 7 [Sorex araneus]|uniref:ribonuclease 7 n=1 Tax=Sorex araneus TaxID=42254 RepID=UPI0003315955|nr:ribonuclease 7 [Sorex araneus]